MASKTKAVSTTAFEALQVELADTINSLNCASAVSTGSRNGDVRVLFRVHDLKKFYDIMNVFVREEKGKGWYSFVGKKLLLHEGKMKWAWVMTVQSDELEEAVYGVRDLLIASARRVAPSKTGNAASVESEVLVQPAPWAARTPRAPSSRGRKGRRR
jgi:hypothetical protein